MKSRQEVIEILQRLPHRDDFEDETHQFYDYERDAIRDAIVYIGDKEPDKKKEGE